MYSRGITKKTPVSWYFHGARYFDPQLATWHSPDPLSESSTHLSPYAYVANNPVNFVDPNGMYYAKPSDWEREQAREGAYCSEIGWKMAGMMGRPEFYSGADAYFSQGKWSYNWSTGRYENSYSGESFSATEYASAEALAYMGIDFDYYDFSSFYSDMASRNNGEDFYITLEFGYDKLWVVGNSKITGDPSSYGAVTSSNYQSYGEAEIIFASNSGTPWMTIAEQEFSNGVAEIPGPIHNNRIVEYFTATSYRATTDDPPNHWCSAFVNWTMKQANIAGTNSAAAKSWLNWGNSLENYQFGAVTVLERNGSFHVGYAVDLTDSYVRLLGGNQGNPGSVKYSNFYLRSYNVYYLFPTGY